MNQDAFIEEKRENWDRLSALLSQIKAHGIRSFKTDEVRLLGGLYRKACSDLSYARSRNYNPDLVRYLNQLARKAYGYIYLSDSEHKGKAFKFFTTEFPEIFRKNFRFILLAILFFLLGGAVGYLWNEVDPKFVRQVVPQQILMGWEKQTNEEVEDDENRGITAKMFPFMASWYWTHNFKVGMYSFAMGVIFGIGPLGFMIYNGLIFGALTSMVISVNNHHKFFSFVLSHSFVELLAIFICGGAGFMIGWALISPGDMYRADALNKMGKEAVKLVLGTIPMFLIAGIIESSFSRLKIPIGYKILFAVISILLMYLYFSYNPEKREKKKEFKV